MKVDRLINSDTEYQDVLEDITVLRSRAINAMPKGTEANHLNIMNELTAEFE